ncbi:MAG: hypothetical protein KTR35_16930 [Gammaproteobacteria bacterium]|nr:hypothetical protein [Gammaproteobacteria bacterium]
MYPYVFLGIFALSTTILAGIISFLVSLGVSLLAALSGLYLFAVVLFYIMMKCATRLDDDCEFAEQGGYIKYQSNSETTVSNQIKNLEASEIKRVA